MGIEPGGDELPELPDDVRAGENERGHEGDAHVDHERLLDAGGQELGVFVAGVLHGDDDGLDDPLQDVDTKPERDAHGDDQGDDATQDTVAELEEVISEGHLAGIASPGTHERLRKRGILLLQGGADKVKKA